MKFSLMAAILLVALTYSSPQSNSTKDVYLQLVNPQITENGELIYEGGECGGGNLLAFHLPIKGWFVLSTEPQPEYDFQKIGKLSGNRISFSLDNRAYEIVSQEAIDPEKQQEELWVVRIAPPADHADKDGKLISCATSFKYWLAATLHRNEKQ